MFWLQRDIKTVDDLVPLLRRQSEELGAAAELVNWFITFVMLYVGYNLYDLFQHANGAKADGDGDGPR